MTSTASRALSTSSALLAQVTPERLALVRTALGAGMLVRPTAVPTLLGSDAQTAARSAWLVRMLGGREVALGAGALAASPAARPGWLAGGLLSDATDAVVLTAAVATGRLGGGTLRTLLVVGAATASFASVAVHARALLARR